MLGSLFVILPADFLWIHDLAESIYSFLLVWWVLFSYLKNCLLVCVSVYVCSPDLDCFFSARVYFENWKTKKCFAVKEAPISKLSIVTLKMRGSSGFILKLNMKWVVVSPRRYWGSFRNGAAWQPWSRNCSDAAASSSTAPLWACSSWLPPSALTRVPRGQILAGNMFFKETTVTLTFKNLVVFKNVGGIWLFISGVDQS